MLNKLYRQSAERVAPRTMSCILHGIGVTVASLLLVSGYIAQRYLMSQHDNAERQHLEAVTLVHNRDQIDAERARLSQLLDQAVARNKAASMRVPQEPNEIEFLEQISDIAKRVGLQIRDYRPGPNSERATYREAEIVLRAESDYDSLCGFIAALQTMPRMCRINMLNITSSTGTSSNSRPAVDKPESLLNVELRIGLAYELKTSPTI